MQNELPADEILKLDRRGRVWVSKERREALLDEFERCGVSAVQFAAQYGLKYSTFALWKQKRRRSRGGSAEPKTVLSTPAASPGDMRWMEAVLEADKGIGASGQKHLMISLPGGARMEIAHRGQVALAVELLRMLEGRERAVC
jgi:hypothetical protein